MQRSPAPPFQVNAELLGGRGAGTELERGLRCGLVFQVRNLCNWDGVYSKSCLRHNSLFSSNQMKSDCHPLLNWQEMQLCPLLLLPGFQQKSGRLIWCPENKQVSQCVTDVSNRHCPRIIQEVGSPDSGPSSFHGSRILS